MRNDSVDHHYSTNCNTSSLDSHSACTSHIVHSLSHFTWCFQVLSAYFNSALSFRYSTRCGRLYRLPKIKKGVTPWIKWREICRSDFSQSMPSRGKCSHALSPIFSPAGPSRQQIRYASLRTRGRKISEPLWGSYRLPHIRKFIISGDGEKKKLSGEIQLPSLTTDSTADNVIVDYLSSCPTLRIRQCAKY